MLPIKINNELSLSTVLELLVMLVAFVVAWEGIKSRMDQFQVIAYENRVMLNDNNAQLSRIEAYLAMKDKEYWKTIKVFPVPRGLPQASITTPSHPTQP